MEWKNKVVIITGATSGIGMATRILLSQNGCIVYNLDIAAPADNNSYFIECDIRNRTAIREAVKSIASKEERIDMLFANAGIHLFATIEETSDEQIDNIVAINILATFCIVQAVLPYMKKQMKGSIVLMGSDQTFVGKASSAAYGMTKGATGQLTKSTAIDYAKYNIRVNCICPGTIDTPLLHKALEQYSTMSGEKKSDILTGLNAIQPLGRIGTAIEIATAVSFLLSDESSFITGCLLSADGGYVCQ